MTTTAKPPKKEEHMELNRWKLIAGGAALVGIAAGGINAATADDGLELNDRQGQIVLVDTTTTAPDTTLLDDSPESADSPNESVEESADSPFDSPDDPGWVDPSPESADSPNESVEESADSPFDSPDDAGFVAPAPAPTPAPAPPPPPAGGSADSGNSPDSPDSGDS
jgi:hypothetical protein